MITSHAIACHARVEAPDAMAPIHSAADPKGTAAPIDNIASNEMIGITISPVEGRSNRSPRLPHPIRPMTAAILEQIVSYVGDHRPHAHPFDVTIAATLPDTSADADSLADLEAAGVTWWRAGWDPDGTVSFEDWLTRLREGPPRP